MRADIHDGQEHKRSIHGPDTEAQDQSSPSVNSACNTRPVHTAPKADVRSQREIGRDGPNRDIGCGSKSYKNLAPYLVYSSAIYAAVYLAFSFLTISYKVSDEINRIVFRLPVPNFLSRKFVFIPKWCRVWWACFWLTSALGTAGHAIMSETRPGTRYRSAHYHQQHVRLHGSVPQRPTASFVVFLRSANRRRDFIDDLGYS